MAKRSDHQRIGRRIGGTPGLHCGPQAAHAPLCSPEPDVRKREGASGCERLRPWVASPAAAQDGASDHAAAPDEDVQVLRLVGTQRLRRGLAQLQLDRGAAALVHGHELLQRRGRRGRQLVQRHHLELGFRLGLG